MAQYYAQIKGNRGMASRMGTKSSGIWGHIRGWNVGAFVDIRHDPDKGDIVRVYRTNGSSGTGADELIAEFTDEEYTTAPIIGPENV